MRNMDFSLAIYTELCKALQSHKVFTVQQYLTNVPKSPCIVLRHDVDRSIKNALAMAELENQYGIRSTYYFRYPKTFNSKVMKQIDSLGHEIGYHYEVLDKTKGDYQKAIALFQKELEIFRQSFPVKTVCMHGNPLTKWDSRDIWQHYDYRAFGIIGEAFLSFHDFSLYLTDTGRNWNGDNNFKDRLQVEDAKKKFKSSADVLRFLNSCTDTNLYINCHPERWGFGFKSWSIAFLRDHFFNLCKKIIKFLRSGSKGRTS